MTDGLNTVSTVPVIRVTANYSIHVTIILVQSKCFLVTGIFFLATKQVTTQARLKHITFRYEVQHSILCYASGHTIKEL